MLVKIKRKKRERFATEGFKKSKVVRRFSMS